jgi:uncharacterized membrane protein YeaQ/YmgE (transglycosylase-associated protein family)
VLKFQLKSVGPQHSPQRDHGVQSKRGSKFTPIHQEIRTNPDGSGLADYHNEPKREAGDMFAWILVGLISGWLAGKILNGNGYGMMADIGLGLLGGVAGGMIFAILGVQAHNLIGMILMSTAGATALVIATRIIRDEI